MRTTRNVGLSMRLTAIVCCAVLLTPPPAFADWGSGGRLPGISSTGETIRTVLIIAGLAVGGGILANRLFGRNRGDGIRSVQKQLDIEPGATTGEITLVNASEEPVRIVGIDLARGDAFALEALPSALPVVLQPQEPLHVRVAVTSSSSGKFNDQIRVSTRTSAAEKVTVKSFRVRASVTRQQLAARAEVQP